MSPPELRKDAVLNRWVLVSNAERLQPASCPACAVLASGSNIPAGAILDRRAVVDRTRAAGELQMTMTGAGEHEIIVESNEHGVPFSALSVEQLHAALMLYRERLLYLAQDNRFRYLTIVKTPSEHAYSEAFALPMVPPEMKEKIQGAHGYQRRTGTCVYCDLVKHERAEKTRRIAESMRHIALAPFASRAPFEMVLLPKGHHSDFATSSDPDLADLAALLSECLRRADAVVPGANPRMVLETAPPDMGSDLQQFHWHLSLQPVPETARKVGAVAVNPVAPEEAAKILREAAL